MHLDVGDVVPIVLDAPLRRYFAEHVRKFECVHVKGISERLAELRTLLRNRAEPQFADNRLHRRRLAKRNRPVAHMPTKRRTINRLDLESVECVIEVLAVAVQPVDVFDGLLECAVYPFEKIQRIDTDDRQDVIDMGDRGLANANAGHVR